VTIHDLLHTGKFGGRKWPGEVLRLAMLMTHYREPVDFSVNRLEEAETILDGWYRAVGEIAPHTEIDSEMLHFLSDDLDTSGARSALDALRAQAAKGNQEARRRLKTSAGLLGLLSITESEWNNAKLQEKARLHHLHAQGTESRSEASSPQLGTFSPQQIDMQIGTRLEFIREKNWAEADRIRDELLRQGIQLKDSKDAQTGERVTTWEVRR
jgi:cysteinyl-tRNA synthetase